MSAFKKILIANRGEIASRIIKAAKELQINTVAIYAKQDFYLDFVNDADESVMLQGETISDTYLNISQIIKIAKEFDVDAIHPGYGFLSEIAEFAKNCYLNNIVFIGPDAATIEQMGDKLESRKIAEVSKIPVLSAITGTPDDILKRKKEFTYPLLIKASAGGGGKGMKVVKHHNELEDALWLSKQQAKNYFGNDTIYLEKYLENPRHIEVQIFGDNFGNFVHLFERECSIQRRHQKIIEESPSPSITEDLRKKLTSAALKLIKTINYKNAGTVEFLVQDDKFYFLEMNTRIQVEHPVTEEATGIDLVKEQIKVAEGNLLSFSQEDIAIKKHAIQYRVYAEDPENDFRPSPGEIIYNSLPKTAGCRIDTLSKLNTFLVASDFDPLLTKLITKGRTRKEAIQKMDKALSDYTIHGIKNNISYLRQIIRSESFSNGEVDTKYIIKHNQELFTQLHSQKSNIPLFTPLFGTYLYQAESGNVQNIWNTVGRWRAVDVISGKVDTRDLRGVIVFHNNNSIKFLINDIYHDFDYKILSKNTIDFFIEGKSYVCVVSRHKQNNIFEVTVNGFDFIVERTDILKTRSLDEYLSERNMNSLETTNGIIKSPLSGKAIKVNFKDGDKVTKGDVIVVIESMKTENKIVAEHEGIISDLSVLEGQQVRGEQLLLRLN